LGAQKPFMYDMTHAVRKQMKDAYPELNESAERVSNVIHEEERRFAHTLELGLSRLDDLIQETVSTQASSVRGDKTFQLYDTFGLPLDFMTDAARDAGLQFDQAGFDQTMTEQRERARASWRGGAGKATASPAFRELKKTEFEGYRQTESDNCEVLAIVHNGQGVKELHTGSEGEIVLDHTPFYAESGGQVGDIGWFYK